MAQGNGSIGAEVLTDARSLAKAPGWFWNAEYRVYRQALDLSLASVAKSIADTNLLFRKPRGTVIDKIVTTSSVSLTTSQLAFGVPGTPAKYGAAKAYGTTPKAQVPWAEPTAMDDDPTTAEELVMMTISEANLPSSGIVIIDMFVLSSG